MKKLFGFIIVLFVVFSLYFVYAQGTEGQPALTSTEVGQDLKTNLDKVGDVTGGIMEKEISLPAPLDSVFIILFNLEKTPSLQEFILLLGGFIVLFLIIASLLEIFGFFDNSIVRYSSAFVIILLISVSNGLDLAKFWILSLLNMFNSRVASILAVVITIVVIFFVLKLLKKAKAKADIAKAEREGMEVGASEAKLKIKAKSV